ncbi:MAG: PKD domain-containing protein [Planctomycetota bacterium]
MSKFARRASEVLAGILGVAPLAAQNFPMPPHFEAVYASPTLSFPLGLRFAADGTLFVLEKAGGVRVLTPEGALQPVPFLDLSAEVNNDHDRGLLGIALDPSFVPDGGPTSWVYFLYTVSPIPGQDNGFNQGQRYSFSRLTRYRAITVGTNVVADIATREILLGHQQADGSVPDGIASIHNSHSNGSLRFARDGSLLVATGDGAHYDFRDTGGFDAAGFDDFVHPTTGLRGPTPKVQDVGSFRSQDLRSLAGKILRIDKETGLGLASNPFFDGDLASHASRVWALGLRNPFRMDLAPGSGATDPALGDPGVVLLGDVGWNRWEEIDVATSAGTNFGWPCFEGAQPQPGYQQFTSSDPSVWTCTTPTVGVLASPAVAWHHSDASIVVPPGVHVDEQQNPMPGFAGVCAIGGPIYTGGSYPAHYVGRMFFADYGRRYIKTIEFDAAWQVVAVRDFASQTGPLAAIERHPISGDLYVASLQSNRVLRIRYGANATPVPHLAAAPLAGTVPLAVQFDASGTLDPDQDALTFTWDFGDGSATASGPNPTHVYTVDGTYSARLTVADSFGASAETDVQIAVGNRRPKAILQSPAHGSTFEVPATLELRADGLDPEGWALAYRWNVTLFHATHQHPGTFQSDAQNAVFDIASSPEDPELRYYRIELTVTDRGGLSDTTHAFVYPRARVTDISGTATPIARVFELAPPGPLAGRGNLDIEVIRDRRTPPVGAESMQKQFASYHAGAQLADDWIGYELSPTPEFRFVGLTFQEGRHFADGGWFEDARVEVRENGIWSTIEDALWTPGYPFGEASQPYFDGVYFQTYRIRFDPVYGDAIRIRGKPGGSARFVTCAELATETIAAYAAGGLVDWTSSGIAFEGSTPGATNVARDASHDPLLALHDGTYPPVGSTSALGEVTTRSSPAGAQHAIGYRFDTARTIRRVLYQEGRDLQVGGAFETLAVETQSAPGGPWVVVPNVAVQPPHGGADGVSYTTFTLDFAPVDATAIRIRGSASGSLHYVSAGELRVLGPRPP